MKRYFLRLRANGSWHLYDQGHEVCAGRRWNHSLATHIHRLMVSRETGVPLVSKPPGTRQSPLSLNQFLNRMASP